MIEERLEKMENMLEQLIQMVGENNKGQKELAERMDCLENRFDRSEEKNELRHQEHMNKFDEIKLDQIFSMKKQLKMNVRLR